MKHSGALQFTMVLRVGSTCGGRYGRSEGTESWVTYQVYRCPGNGTLELEWPVSKTGSTAITKAAGFTVMWPVHSWCRDTHDSIHSSESVLWSIATAERHESVDSCSLGERRSRETERILSYLSA